jgi:hypothetical protein
MSVILLLDTGVFSSNMQGEIRIALRLEEVPDHTSHSFVFVFKIWREESSHVVAVL